MECRYEIALYKEGDIFYDWVSVDGYQDGVKAAKEYSKKKEFDHVDLYKEIPRQGFFDAYPEYIREWTRVYRDGKLYMTYDF